MSAVSQKTKLKKPQLLISHSLEASRIVLREIRPSRGRGTE